MTSEEHPGDAGYDEWADSLTDGGYYLECDNGHASLPPRHVCPECGNADLHERDMPPVGEVVTFSRVHVAPPDFVDDTPYITAIVGFGPVRVTGIVRETEEEALEIGTPVTADVTQNPTTGRRLVVFEPR